DFEREGSGLEPPGERLQLLRVAMHEEPVAEELHRRTRRVAGGHVSDGHRPSGRQGVVEPPEERGEAALVEGIEQTRAGDEVALAESGAEATAEQERPDPRLDGPDAGAGSRRQRCERALTVPDRTLFLVHEGDVQPGAEVGPALEQDEDLARGAAAN